ncbi:unnamed protein product [Strongylus vulgaris]|uniref:Uncharacterized protein n=1 Tax=Strongylus vulgaris TaxID=40348 RepID=A0A3P7JI33_STRVU|nr:unnamed protein product [Strongylus vulgaris]
MVEKTQPGPFGFYIATGVMNGQRDFLKAILCAGHLGIDDYDYN